LTAGTVFLCSVALYGFGGPSSMTCILLRRGVLTGTYSSIYIASPVVHLVPPRSDPIEPGRREEAQPQKHKAVR